MPVSYSFNDRIFRLDCVGEYSSEDLRHAYEAALKDPGFPNNAVFLMDVTYSKSLAERPPQEIDETSKFLGSKAEKFGKRCAIVAPFDLYYGLMRMASAFGERYGVETEVFRTEDKALEWLKD